MSRSAKRTTRPISKIGTVSVWIALDPRIWFSCTAGIVINWVSTKVNRRRQTSACWLISILTCMKITNISKKPSKKRYWVFVLLFDQSSRLWIATWSSRIQQTHPSNRRREVSSERRDSFVTTRKEESSNPTPTTAESFDIRWTIEREDHRRQRSTEFNKATTSSLSTGIRTSSPSVPHPRRSSGWRCGIKHRSGREDFGRGHSRIESTVVGSTVCLRFNRSDGLENELVLDWFEKTSKQVQGNCPAISSRFLLGSGAFDNLHVHFTSAKQRTRSSPEDPFQSLQEALVRSTSSVASCLSLLCQTKWPVESTRRTASAMLGESK